MHEYLILAIQSSSFHKSQVPMSSRVNKTPEPAKSTWLPMNPPCCLLCFLEIHAHGQKLHESIWTSEKDECGGRAPTCTLPSLLSLKSMTFHRTFHHSFDKTAISQAKCQSFDLLYYYISLCNSDRRQRSSFTFQQAYTILNLIPSKTYFGW